MELLDFLSRIEDLCKQKNLKRQNVYINCGVGKDFGVSIRNGSEPSIGKVFALASELDCSIDYLLDRTDDPNAHKGQNYAINNHDTVINGTQANVINNETVDSEVIELAQLIKSLPIVKRAEAILAIEEIKNK